MAPKSEPHIAVIGGGIAGLATAVNLLAAARTSQQPVRVTVLEKSHTPGGNLQTIRQDGWQLECGPNGFLDNEPATLRLVSRLGLDEELVCSSDATRHRFLLVDGQVQEIPTSPRAFITSGLLPWTGKLRMAGEIFVPARRDLGLAATDPDTDETVAAFGRRRLGHAFTEIMLDPMVKGIFGGEAEQLSLAAAFPRMVELEQEHGGLFKAMIKLARRRKNATDAGPSGTLHSFTRGMGQFITAMTDFLARNEHAAVITDAETVSVGGQSGRWTVSTPDTEYGPFDAVVAAAPAHASARQLCDLDPAFGELLGQIPFAPMAIIALGFRREAVGHDLNGFGLLVPGRERRPLLGALWTSSIFAGRAPAGHVLLRCMAGGAGNPGVMELDDDALTKLILGQVRPLLRIEGAPALVKIIRHQRAIAQYTPGHLARLRKLDALCAAHPGLYLTGSSYRGISVNYCLKEAETTAAAVMQNLGAPTRADAEVNR